MAFHWIFIVIAGAVILLFFTKIMIGQFAFADQEAAASVLVSFERVIGGKAVAVGEDSQFALPSRTLSLYCNEPCSPATGCDSGIAVGDFSSSLATQPVLGPAVLRGDSLYAFTLSWDIPYHVTNFLYLAIPGQKIIFPQTCVGLCNEVYTMIPQRLKDRGIVLKGPSPTIEFGSCITPSAICVDVNENKLMFPDGTSVPYYGKETILAALFAQDAQDYECNMKKAVYQFDHVTSILRAQQDELLAAMTMQNCIVGISNAQTELDRMPTSYSAFSSNPKIIADISTSLENNNVFLRRSACPSTY